MLNQLTAVNLGVIKHATLDFSPSFNVISGETGTGKTMLLNAIGLISGKRSDNTLIRKNATMANVTASFCLKNMSKISKDKLTEFGVDTFGEFETITKRTLQNDKPSSAMIDATKIPVKTLEEWVENLVIVYSQGQTYKLLNKQTHIEKLDIYSKNGKCLSEYAEAFQKLAEIKQELKQCLQTKNQNFAQKDYFKDVIAKIDKVNPSANEDVMISQSLIKLEGIVNKTIDFNFVTSLLNASESDILPNLWQISARLVDITKKDRKYQALCDRFNVALNEIEAVASALSNTSETEEFDQKELENLKKRYEEIESITRIFDTDVNGILQKKQQMQAKLAELDKIDQKIEQLLGGVNYYTNLVKKRAEILRKSRKTQALEEAVNQQLADLDMKGIRFHVDIVPSEHYTINGNDKIEFMISSNVSNRISITKAASGGELARIMLALELVLLESSEQGQTIIFDEIDQGVGGQTATKIGKKLQQLAKNRQVIVVTHLAQIAALADRQFLVTKNDGETEVSQLDQSARIYEIARMLSGSITPVSLEHAKELLDYAS